MKRLLSVLCITALLLGSITGCGKEEVTLEQPYDIYETTGSLGLGTTVSAGAQEYFSKETKIHCNRVEQYTKAMAEELGLSAYDTKMLTVAARYHDIGKYYIPEKILNAPRPLTGLERKVIDMHAYYGYEACMEYGFEKDICELILLHHGTHKYRTLTDEQISDFAKEYFQILMAADIYDALISDRVYRRAIDHDRALDIVENPEIKRWVFLALEKISLC